MDVISTTMSITPGTSLAILAQPERERIAYR
jgi:hypothetical protein